MGDIKKSDYYDALEELEHELVGMARWARAKGERIVVIFEGRDTAGKGGAIRAEQVADLLALLDQTAGARWVVAGDFNVPADAPELSPLADRAADAFGTLHPGAAVSTLVEALGHTPRRIDHVFAGPGLTPEAARLVLAEPVGGVQPSDHRGVWVRLRWPSVPCGPGVCCRRGRPRSPALPWWPQPRTLAPWSSRRRAR